MVVVAVGACGQSEQEPFGVRFDLHEALVRAGSRRSLARSALDQAVVPPPVAAPAPTWTEIDTHSNPCCRVSDMQPTSDDEAQAVGTWPEMHSKTKLLADHVTSWGDQIHESCLLIL